MQATEAEGDIYDFVAKYDFIYTFVLLWLGFESIFSPVNNLMVRKQRRYFLHILSQFYFDCYTRALDTAIDS